MEEQQTIISQSQTPKKSPRTTPTSPIAAIRRSRKHAAEPRIDKSIHDYAKRVEAKDPNNRTESEQKFLWRYQRKLLIQTDKLSIETLREYVFRLLQKDDRTPAENRLIRQYQRRRKARRQKRRDGDDDAEVPHIIWKRNNRWTNKAAQTGSSLTLSSDMSTLRETMGKLGLSCKKLRDVEME